MNENLTPHLSKFSTFDLYLSTILSLLLLYFALFLLIQNIETHHFLKIVGTYHLVSKPWKRGGNLMPKSSS